jgi:hypothetical protein
VIILEDRFYPYAFFEKRSEDDAEKDLGRVSPIWEPAPICEGMQKIFLGSLLFDKKKHYDEDPSKW